MVNCQLSINKKHLLFFVLSLSFFISNTFAASYVPQTSHRVKANFNTGWLYNATNNAAFSGGTSFNDAAWIKVNLPHTTVIGHARGTPSDTFEFISWYRKHFTPITAGRHYILNFDGVASAATVYVNGTQVGIEHLSAYTGFQRDITSLLTIGADNVIAVKADATHRTDFPPLGGNMDYTIFGGMVRDVKLILVDSLHVDYCFARTTNPSQTAYTSPTVMDSVKVVNNSKSQKTCTIVVSIVDTTNNNNVVASVTSTAKAIAAGDSNVFFVTTSAIVNPHLWNVDDPFLYKVYTQVLDGTNYVDEYITRTGIRSITLNATTGRFFINGKPLKLRGQNRHETFPCIGRSAADRVQRKDADILKYDLGCNMVRTSHYTQSTAFLDRCDEIGILLLEEMPGWNYIGGTAWQTQALNQIREMIVRDRNHPSIFTFAVRINESADNDAFYTQTNALARGLDPSRLTSGVRKSNGTAASFLEDIWCQNFLVPTGTPSLLPWITTETVGHGYPTHSWSPPDSLYGLILAHANEQSGNYSDSMIAGVLSWCAFDYHSPHANATTNEIVNGKPSYISPHGMADMFRILKPSAGYLFQSQPDPAKYGYMAFIANQWQSNFSTDVWVMSNCAKIELFVNGVSAGKMAANVSTILPHGFYSFGGITYSAGSLVAIGYDATDNVVFRDTQYTPGTATHLSVIPDDAVIDTGGDMTRVVVRALDSHNQYVPRLASTITISVSGTSSEQQLCPATEPLEDGKYAFFVKSNLISGTINCSVSSTGLTTGSATVTVSGGSSAAVEPAVSTTVPLLPQIVWTKTVRGNHILIPSWAVLKSDVAVYDLTGKLIYKNPAKSAMIDLYKTVGAAKDKIYIVRIENFRK